MDLLLILAVLPAAALMYYVYTKDKVEKEPPKLIARMFLLGVVSGPIAAILENILFVLFEGAIPQGPFLIIIEYFIGVAAVEEGLKYIFLNTIRKNREFNYVFDGIVYGVAVSLGFATLENILYVFSGGIEVAIMRAIFSVPGHCAGGVLMGCFFGLARQREVAGNKSGARTFYILAFVLPWIEHGFYDAALSFESDALALLALGVELAFIIFGFILVHKMSKSDSAIYPAGTLPPSAAAHQGTVAPGAQPNMAAGGQQNVMPGMQHNAAPGAQPQYGAPVQQQYPQAGQVYQQPMGQQAAGQPYQQPMGQPMPGQQVYQQPYQQQAQQPYQQQAQPYQQVQQPYQQQAQPYQQAQQVAPVQPMQSSDQTQPVQDFNAPTGK